MLIQMLPSILLNIFSPFNIFILFAGMAVGITIGALPGLTATMGVALLLPFTFRMDTMPALLLLCAVYCGGIYGGSITAVLLKTPGTPASAATAEDGFALSKRGQARSALEMTLYASTFGGVLSCLALLGLAPQIAKIALEFGPPEYACLAFFGLTIIISVSGGNIVKGLIAGCLGILLSCIGLDPISGGVRYTFGSANLMAGLQLVPTMIGLFAVSQILEQAQRMGNLRKGETTRVGTGNPLPMKLFFEQTVNMIRSSIIGILVGALPGTGSAIASFISVNAAKRSSKNPEEYGKGSYEAIAASEAGNNAVTGAAMIPLLTLGVPGDVTTAVMLGALIIKGIKPGPAFFTSYPDIAYGIIVGFLVIQFVMLAVGFVATKGFARVAEIPSQVLTPIVAVLCVIGAYAINNSVFDTKLILVMGLVGFLLPKFGFPTVPILIGFILGETFEKGIRQGLVMSTGDWSIFVSRPICIFFLAIALLFLGSSVYREVIKPLRDRYRVQIKG